MDRYCRICYNTKDWCEPSGDAAELELGNTFAVINGFGHEEWLFDLTTLLSPDAKSEKLFKYGFLQPIGKYRSAYIGEYHNVALYTVSPQKEKLAVGILKNLFVPDDGELETVYRQAKEKGLIEIMSRQAATFQPETSHVDLFEGEAHQIFNVRFSPEDLQVFGSFPPIPPDNPVYKSDRYHPLKIGDMGAFERFGGDSVTHTPVPGNSGDHERSEAVRRKCAVMGTTYSPQHVILQNKVYRHLQKIHGVEAVLYEENFVDLTVKGDEKPIYFEIKIKSSVRACLREAMGQLLEYCHYPDLSKASKLIVVSDKNPADSDKIYIRNIREKYKLPIFYQSWSDEVSCLSACH